ncbi:hypothetical protein EQG68_03825 [Flavobacterium piscinae]|uniref:Uncharacterized protein n=2 Tax=Flavobacterium piscinae TaxID=2506424 RepID=A0A4Q1KXZ2_9FLAO|nr:hypothetical protein EQG68_03825 [Flavobacterium piscinae]
MSPRDTNKNTIYSIRNSLKKKEIQIITKYHNIMKTLFALLGLFMFVSVSSSDLSVNSTSENGDGSAVTGGKRALVIQMSENGDGSAVTGGKRALVIQ